ncbi:unnamed protein product [Meloidogyne enterolobii]|uniref:Uncharacterized protein n=1 Tax=Meloidogyne enterolobii TaxID=390850 RepID=A0ACB0YXA3_MELEN
MRTKSNNRRRKSKGSKRKCLLLRAKSMHWRSAAVRVRERKALHHHQRSEWENIFLKIIKFRLFFE